jgi:hypothetical protein
MGEIGQMEDVAQEQQPQLTGLNLGEVELVVPTADQ